MEKIGNIHTKTADNQKTWLNIAQEWVKNDDYPFKSMPKYDRYCPSCGSPDISCEIIPAFYHDIPPRKCKCNKCGRQW